MSGLFRADVQNAGVNHRMNLRFVRTAARRWEVNRMRLIDADALIEDCQLAQKQANRDGREYANAFYSGGDEISTEWWCVEDMIENAPTIEPERKRGI